jgi:hypothetical protein
MLKMYPPHRLSAMEVVNHSYLRQVKSPATACQFDEEEQSHYNSVLATKSGVFKMKKRRGG